MNTQRALGGGYLMQILSYSRTCRIWQSASILMALCAPSYATDISVPIVAVTTVDQAKSFSQNDHNAVSLVDDVDVPWGGSDTLTLTASSGTLSLSGLTGLSFSSGDGTADATMGFSGSLADVNAALDGLVFTPAAGVAGSSTLTIAVSGSQSVSSTLKIAVNATMDAEAARDQILAGVTSLADPTQPGYMVVYGDNAYSITNYPGGNIDDPMVAAATWGAGKVLAMPDHQWLNMGSYGGDASTGTYYKNGISWLAGSTSLGIKVVTYNNQANADWLVAQGFTNVVNTISANLAADLVGADAFIAGWLGSNVSQSLMDDIRDYAVGGGGVFITEYGPGYGWWWGKSTEEIPGNILLREAGIGFTQNYPHGGVQNINRATSQMTGDDVLAIIQNPAGYTETEKNLAASIFDKLNAILRDNDPLQLRLDDVFWTKIGTINPTPTTPVSDSLEKALLNREGQILKGQAVAEMTAHRTALPVGASAPRVNKAVTLPETVTGHDYWVIDTGLYAAPGETVSITVPAAMVGVGVKVQIGHLRTDTGDANYYTMPYQQLFFDLDTATMDVASPHGGLLMFVAPSGTEWIGTQAVQVNGAVEAPYFVYGTNTNVEWTAGVRDRETPFGVLVSDTSVLVIESEQYLRTLSDPHEVMDIHRNLIWWIDDFYDYHRGRPLRIHHDYQPVGGASSMPLSYGVSSNITDYNALVVGGEALTMHEHGHHADHNNILFYEFGETAPNLGGKYAQQMYMPFSWKQDLAVGRVNNYQRSLTDDLWNHYNHYAVDVKGTIHDSIGAVFGWDKVRTIVHNISNDGTISTDQDRLDALLVQMSQTVGYDVSPFLEDWQLSFSATALSTVSVLPKWHMVEVIAEDLVVKQDTAVTFGDPSLNDFSYDGTLTFNGLGNPSSGALVDNGNGTFTYTPNGGFTGDDSMQYTVTNGLGNVFTGTIKITVNAAVNYPAFESNDTHAGTSGWTVVTLNQSFTSMVVVAQAVVSDSTPPVVTRIRNASGNSFEVMLQRVDGQAGDVENVQIRYMVAEEGVYDVATHGVKMEAVKYTSTVTDTTGSFVGETRTMAHNMHDHYFIPTVFGQVMSYNDTAWSAFWYKKINDKLQLGKHVGEDPSASRSNETVGYIIMEAGSLQIGDYRMQVGGLGSDAYNGFSGLSSSTASHDFTRFPHITSALVAADISVPRGGSNPGDEGFWVVQKQVGSGNSVAASIIEDQIADSEQDAGSKGGSYLLVSYMGDDPVLSDDVLVSLEGFSSLVDVLANDSAGQGGTLSITGFTQAAHGTVVDNGDGTFTYTADAAYTGPDFFTYTASSGSGSDTAVVTIDVQASQVSQPGILREKWTGVSGTGISDLTNNVNYPDSPTSSGIISTFEAPSGDGDNYGQRLTGYLVPPTTGDYTFWIASDDTSDLYLSSNSSAINASRIAYVSGWVGEKSWTQTGSQQSVVISLEAGKAYYIEALHKEGGGGDHLAVAWQGPGIAQAVIANQYLYTVGNTGPSVANPIADVQVAMNATDTVIDLSNVFTDSDPGDVLTLEIAGNTNGSLLTASLNGTELTLSYAAGQSGTANVSIRALDRLNTVVVDTFQVDVVTTNFPVLNDTVFALPDGSAIGASVGTVLGTDADVGDTLTYSITGGNTGGAFVIGSSSGAITTAVVMDFATTPSYSLTVTVTDSNGLTDTAIVTVTANVNDRDGDGYTDDFEDEMGTDPDDVNSVPTTPLVAYWNFDDDSTPSVSYDVVGAVKGSFLSGAAYSSDAGGRSAQAGDYGLDLGTTDGGQRMDVAIVEFLKNATADDLLTISFWQKRSNINASSSFWAVSPSSADDQRGIQTHAPWTTGAVYLDMGDSAAGHRISSPTSGVTWSDWHHFAFVKNGATAEIWLDGNLLVTSNGMAALVSDFTSLVIGANGTGGNSVAGVMDDFAVYNRNLNSTEIGNLATGASPVDIVGNRPPVASDATFSIDENSTIGSVVGTVVATDPFVGDTLSYTITTGNDSGLFSIDSSGVITTLDELDFESGAQHVLTVTVTDSIALSDTATITININNVNDAPSVSDASGSVVENSISGLLVATVTASDVDAGDSLSYVITGGNGNGFFAIDGSGQVTTTGALDYEFAAQYLLTIEVSDDGTPLLTSTSTVTVDVTNVNEAPIATDSSGSFAENGGIGATVATVLATDVDAGDSLSYSITAGNDSGLFGVDSLGNITAAASFNFEVANQYVLTVEVSDAGGLSDTATVTLNVTNVNESGLLGSQAWEEELYGSGYVARRMTELPGNATATVDLSTISGDATYEFVVNAEDFGQSVVHLLDGNGTGLRLEQWNNIGELGVTRYGVGDYQLTAEAGQSVASPYGAVHHIVYVVDSVNTQTDVYMDGVLVGTVSGAYVINDAASILGDTTLRNDSSPGIYAFAAYNNVLTDSEIKDRYHAWFGRLFVDVDGDTLDDEWEVAKYGNIASYNASDDPDGDGISNFREMVFGGYPMLNDAGDPSAQATLLGSAQDTIEFIYRRPQNHGTLNITYQVETSTDLQTWTSVGASPLTVISNNGEANESVRYEFTIPAGNRLFCRSRAIVNP